MAKSFKVTADTLIKWNWKKKCTIKRSLLMFSPKSNSQWPYGYKSVYFEIHFCFLLWSSCVVLFLRNCKCVFISILHEHLQTKTLDCVWPSKRKSTSPCTVCFLNDGRFYISGQKRIHFICFYAHALLTFRAIMGCFTCFVIVSNRITCSLAFCTKVI